MFNNKLFAISIRKTNRKDTYFLKYKNENFIFILQFLLNIR